MLRRFKHFNQSSKPCPICKTREDKETTLVPIPGTETGNICQAVQVHVECWEKLKPILGNLYREIED